MERVGLGQAKLQRKERIGGKVKRRSEAAKTAYQRLAQSSQIPEEVRDEPNGIYLGVDAAEPKRNMDAKLAELYGAYEEKRRTGHVGP